jgi:tRNA (guanine-N7-)-methyltransferase
LPETHEFVPPDYFRELAKAEVFGDPARPLEVDLGCGDGAFLADLAAARPERDFLGVERLLGRVRKACRKAKHGGLANLKVLRLESAYTIGWLLPSAAVARVHLLFPDPWPKLRHRTRRLVNTEFLGGLHRVLEPGGEFLFKSDHAAYFDDTCAAVEAVGRFRRLPWSGDEFFYPPTGFERRWLADGRQVHRARWVLR